MILGGVFWLYLLIFFVILSFCLSVHRQRFRSLSGSLSLGDSLFLLLDVCFRIFEELSDDTSSNGFSSLSESEALSLEDRQRVVELEANSEVVTWHSHLNILGEADVDGDISSTDEALGTVASEEGLGTATFVWLQHVDLTFAVTAHLHGVGLSEAHTTLDLLLGDTTEQDTDVVTSLSRIQRLVESLNTSDGGDLVLAANSNHVHFIIDLGLALLDSASGDDTTSSDVERRVDRHEEVLFRLTNGLNNVLVHGCNELLHGLLADLRVGAIEGTQGTTLNKDSVVAIVVVTGEKLTDLHLDELVHLLVLDDIALVKEHNDCLHANLTAQKDVLTGLRHGTVSSRDDKDATVHTGSTGDHVLDVISVTWAIDVTIMAGLRLVLDRRRVNRDTTSLLLR